MMNLSIILLAVVLAVANAFSQLPSTQKMRSTTALNGWLDKLFDKPMHGHGSGENDLDEQWRLQQEILQERRTHGIDKAHLKAKYRDEKNRKTFDVNSVGGEGYSTGEEMYVEEKKAASGGNKMKFPWDK